MSLNNFWRIKSSFNLCVRIAENSKKSDSSEDYFFELVKIFKKAGLHSRILKIISPTIPDIAIRSDNAHSLIPHDSEHYLTDFFLPQTEFSILSQK